MDRCPICDVAVKSENLVRHLNDIHPRHPDTAKLSDELKAEPGRIAKASSRPIHVSRLQVSVVLVVVLLGVGGYALLPYLSPPPPPLPCVSGEGRAYHWHTQLSIDSGAGPVTIPAGIGIRLGCMEILHTHNADGLIHIEPDTPEQNHLYSIGDFFRVWGKPFGSPTAMHVNGEAVSPSASVSLRDQESIHLQYDSFA